MNDACAIKERESQPFLAIRLRIPASDLPAKIGESYGAIMGYLGGLGKQPAGVPFVAYHNQDTQDLDVEIAIPTAEILAGSDNIYGAEIPAGKVAEYVYTGPYSQMAPAYQKLAEFVAEQGGEVTGVAYEMYIDDPGVTPESELRTLIAFPLK